MKLTIEQVKAIYLKYEQSPDGDSDFVTFLDRVENYGDYVGFKWCGMFVGVESDGYTHT